METVSCVSEDERKNIPASRSFAVLAGMFMKERFI
jgi:hypothetical protein